MVIIYVLIIGVAAFGVIRLRRQYHTNKISADILKKYGTLIKLLIPNSYNHGIIEGTKGMVILVDTILGTDDIRTYSLLMESNGIKVYWNLKSDLYGQVKLEWNFEEHENQVHMARQILADVQKYPTPLSRLKSGLKSGYEKTIETKKKSVSSNKEKKRDPTVLTESNREIVDVAKNELDDSKKLFLAAKGGIIYLQKNYKDLSSEGKFEVLLFNSLVALRAYNEKKPNNYRNVEAAFFKPLFEQAKANNLDYSEDQLEAFINSRFKFYASEIEEIYTNKTNPQRPYIPGRLYSTFYISPLAPDPKPSYDLSELILFYPAFTKMWSWVDNNTMKII